MTKTTSNEEYNLMYFITSPGSVVIYMALLPVLLDGYQVNFSASVFISLLCIVGGGVLLRVKASWDYDKRPPIQRLWTPRNRWHEIETD